MPCAHDKIIYVKIKQSPNIVLLNFKPACVFFFLSPKAVGETDEGRFVRKNELVCLRTYFFFMFTMAAAVRVLHL